MAEYIEREAIKYEQWAVGHLNGPLMVVRKKTIDSIPTADVVEVPCRCKDCKHWMDFPNCGCTEFVKVCALAEYMIGQNGYCLYGERKDGDT